MAKGKSAQTKTQSTAGKQTTSTVRKKRTAPKPSTQGNLYISEIKNNTVILKDGTLRSVLQVSSINFALKSQDEQQAIIQGYISFLNSIDFELQIVIQSRKLDIRPYLSQLDTLAKEQTNELLKVQTVEYRQYIEELVTLSDIMKKTFYVVVPYSPFSKKKKNFWSRSQDILFPSRVIKLADKKFETYQKELNRRVGLVMGGLGSIGLKIEPLETQQLIELYYQMYNPTRSTKRDMPPLNKIRVEHAA